MFRRYREKPVNVTSVTLATGIYPSSRAKKYACGDPLAFALGVRIPNLAVHHFPDRVVPFIILEGREARPSDAA
jgi:hypothetical protein